MKPFRCILCPVDFSEYSRRALCYAVLLGKHCQARLIVQHVLASMHSIDYSFMTPGSLPPECEQSLQQQAATSLNEFVHEVVGASLACEIVLSVGSPTLEIINCALENEADLIVMGTHGRSGFERFMLGSITEKLVRKAQCPVLAVRQLSYAPIEPAFPAVSLDYKTVLVPVDLTEHSAQTMSYAKWLALQCGARLNVIYVMERTVSPIVDPSYSTILVDYWKDVQAEAARMLEELVAPALQEGVLAEHCIVHGKVADEILRAAKAIQADLIIMGARDSWITHLVAIGTTAHQVLIHAECPVLLLRGKG